MLDERVLKITHAQCIKQMLRYAERTCLRSFAKRATATATSFQCGFQWLKISIKEWLWMSTTKLQPASYLFNTTTTTTLIRGHRPCLQHLVRSVQ